MNKIKQVIRCHCEGMGSKKTSSVTGVSRNIVKQYIAKFKELRITLEAVESMPEGDLYDLVHSKQIHAPLPDLARYKRLQGFLPEISKALNRKGMTIEAQWCSYIEKDPQGYGRTQFYNYLMEYRRRGGLTMHIDHKAGEKLFVDYCGNKLKIVDQITGELKEVEVFVAILGCSQFTYVEASESQRKEDFIESCRRALEYIGGVPKAIVPDNLKAAVTRSSKYEPILNETFETFAEHYNTIVLPARAYKPKDKALVENAVKIVYQRIYAGLGDRIFTTIQELNAAIRELLERHNDSPLKQGDSRRKLFEEEERPCLLALPKMPYQVRKIKECKVMKNGHVGLHEDRHYYSVPYQYTGKQVKLIYSSDIVDIYYQFKKVASHARNFKRNRYSTQSEHLASQHKFLSEWNTDFFISKGREISQEVAEYIEKLLDSKAHPEQGYKACSGVLNLARRVGYVRITEACKRASEFGAYSYYILEDILKKGLEKADPDHEDLMVHKITPRHSNVRGKAYYQQQTIKLKNQ